MSKDKASDHWAFLEDFEAPMWVDLKLEGKLLNKELDDEWFHRSHKFHQLPSSKLKAAFKHVDRGGELMIDIERSASPKIPSSVSKSRGKCYVTQKVGTDLWLSMSGNECLVEDADGRALQSKCENEILPISARRDSKLSSNLDEENGSGSALVKSSTTTNPGNENNISSSTHSELNVSANKTKSNITSESNEQPGPEVLDAYNRIIGRRSELLSVMRQSLRKRCTIRMATRGQITDVRQTNGLRSFSEKSSVGSCSVHSQSQDTQVSGTQRASRTPESKNVERLSKESKTIDKTKASTDGGIQYTNNTSDCDNDREPLMLEAKPGKIYPCCPTNRYSSGTSKINIINRAHECGNRGNGGIVKVLKTASNNGAISKVSRSATINIAPKQCNSRQKLSEPKGARARISKKAVAGIGDGKSIVAKSTQAQIMTVKALSVHKRPLAPVNLKDQVSSGRPLAPVNRKDQGSSRRPLAPVNRKDQGSSRRPLAPARQINQGSLTFVSNATKSAATKFPCNGKENNVSKFVSGKKQLKNDRGNAAGGMPDNSAMMKLSDDGRSNVHVLLPQRSLRENREPPLTSKLKPKVK